MSIASASAVAGHALPRVERSMPALPWRLAWQCLALALALAAALTSQAAQAAARKPTTAAASKPAKRSTDKGSPYADHAQAMAWADALAQAQAMDRLWVRQAVAQARKLPAVVRLMQPAPSGTPKNWAAYRARFIEPQRIEAGVRFWQAHRDTLARAEREYGVPAEMIVGILGVETFYGRVMGSFRILDALATLAFDFPDSHPRAAERSEYFRGELAHFLQAQAAAGADPAQPRGSYAGASGLPQFMPGSIVRWAVDFDGDGRIDLRSPADAIGSVARYFQGFGWQTGQPTHFQVRFDTERLDKDGLLAPDILPTFSAAGFAARGAVLDEAGAAHTGLLALVELQNGEADPSYVAGTANFYTVTRYNWSSYYAMAVIELAQEIRRVVSAAGN